MKKGKNSKFKEKLVNNAFDVIMSIICLQFFILIMGLLVISFQNLQLTKLLMKMLNLVLFL